SIEVHWRDWSWGSYICAVTEKNCSVCRSFIVTFPAVIDSGSQTKICASLLQPNETLTMSISLVHLGQSILLHRETSDNVFHHCFDFQAPVVEDLMVQLIRVEVKGATFQLTEERKVMFRKQSPQTVTIIQTDKPIYIPGQTVHFRVVTLDSNLIPVNQTYNLIVVEDNRGNRIGQWTKPTSKSRILQLSHNLNPEAPQGHYRLRVSSDMREQSYMFEVKQYVLPKFEITLKKNNEVSVAEDELEVEVCGKYTYGQPVPGSASMSICRSVLPYRTTPDSPQAPCINKSVEIKESGCALHVFNITALLHTDLAAKLGDQLQFSAEVTEEGTGITRSKEEHIQITYCIGKVQFVETPAIYHHGTIVEGKINATHYRGKPLAHQTIHLFIGKRWSRNLLLNLTTDSDGIARFSLSTSNLPEENIELSVSCFLYPTNMTSLYYTYKTPYIENGEHIITMYGVATPDKATASSLSIKSISTEVQCGIDVPVTIQYVIVGETMDTESVDIIYLVLSKGEIVLHGHRKGPVDGSLSIVKGEVSFSLTITPEMAPSVQILAYSVLPSQRVLAQSKHLPTEKCFRNQVSLLFSPSRAVPGERNTLQLSAQPGSLCGLSAVDQSVLLIEPGKRLSADMIFSMLPQRQTYFPHNVEDTTECLRVRSRRYILPPPPPENDVYETFKNLGLKIATNIEVKTPSCLMYKGKTYHLSYVPFNAYSLAAPQAQPLETAVVQTIRTFFPETWIWDLVEIGESGKAEVSLTVPDTITTWETEMFCVSSLGFGLAKPVELQVFQPFFLELTLPYSIVRGEDFELKATVFNYQSECIMISVTPAPSPDYTLKSTSNDVTPSCLCANGRKTFRWTLIPSVLGFMNVTVSAEALTSQTICDNKIVSVPERGHIDTVTRPLLVKAEGMEKEDSYSWFFCPRGKCLTEEVDLQLPEVIVKGSARGSLSVLGDILGRALQNLDGLLRMPYGCGEQNMAILSPNIYIMEYLNNTGQLTAAIKEKATNFLQSGYQRQLNYRHHNGAYSTFGTGNGNTWLTAFVFRSFGRAKSYIFIDSVAMEKTKSWLLDQQKPNGCFQKMGRLFNNRMKGGVNDDITLTAYITAAMLELKVSNTDFPLSCLRSYVGNISNTYTAALLAYTFSLAGQEDIRDELLRNLDSKALSEGNLLYWPTSPSEHADSLAVEISSYVLLAVLTKPQLTTADLGYASRIVTWLVKQQNPYGGFSSTQDTVVALQALALYSTKVFGSDDPSTVTVQSAAGKKYQFEVTQHNKLLYQEAALQDVTGKYSIEVKGSSCASVQMALFYNIPTPTENATLSIQVEAKGLTDWECQKLNGKTFDLKISELTNMIIVDVKMLSGFTADPDSVKKLESSVLVDRVDQKDDHIIIYVRELSKGIPLFYNLMIREDIPVRNLKPAVVKVYDYYHTSDKSETEYFCPCAGKIFV
uniref:Alpha-2-macroglobulin n=1 Tax=Denticeps clupeoides TaxID=299321 RepID=A0AAY4ACK6_9TELE